MEPEKYKPSVCDFCGQTKDYECALDKGAALIVIAVLHGQRRLNKKYVHLRNDLLAMKDKFASFYNMATAGFMAPTMITNVFVPDYHGLVTSGKEAGTFLVTRKGAKFLRGEPVARVAIIDKRTHSKLRYLNEEIDVITLPELLKSDEIPFWEGEFAKIKKAAALYDDEMTRPGLF